METQNNVISNCYVIVNEHVKVEPTIYLFNPINLMKFGEYALKFETVFEAKKYIVSNSREIVPISIAS